MKKNKSYIKKQILILFLLLICMISFVITFGRYVSKSISYFLMRSKEFYFYSDKLDEDMSIFQIDNWEGTDPYTITINMNSRKNNLVSASYDISYDIECSSTDNVICELNKNNGIILESTNSDTFNIVVTPNRQLDSGDRIIVDVTVKSTSHYDKTLKGRFILVVGVEKLAYEITDSTQNPYLELCFTNTLSYYIAKNDINGYSSGDKIDIETYLGLSDDIKQNFYSARATVSFDPNEILLDNTNINYSKFTNVTTTVINGKTFINGFDVSIDASSSLNIRFYKLNVGNDYSYPNDNNECILTIE